jgi:hypothetical protein
METRMSILFYGKKSMNASDKMLAIYLRVTINGDRFEVSTQRYIEPSKWSQPAGKAKGNSEEARSINTYLGVVKNKVYDYQREILQVNKPFTKETLRNKWLGITEEITHW